MDKHVKALVISECKLLMDRIINQNNIQRGLVFTYFYQIPKSVFKDWSGFGDTKVDHNPMKIV